MNLADPEFELIDPTPNVHTLFIHFDKIFFSTKLASRAVVRWSKRMYSCAGVCSYEGRGGLCDIALSEPLLKLRPRKDLIETLLHEMIHAFLFVTCRDQDRDGHGPNFQAHMHRINKAAGINISIYHDFHDEVELYQTHWWRCNGPCQRVRPNYGIVRRTCNKPPGPKEYWWKTHQRRCGGTFEKIKEPENTRQKTVKPKPKEDITKYIINNNNNNVPKSIPKPVLKDSNIITVKANTKTNSNPQPFSGKGYTINGRKESTTDVSQTVRNIWANKQLPFTPTNKQIINTASSNINKNKHKVSPVHLNSPPAKVKKIDDYFKTAASVLKDLYGQDFNVSQSKNNKLVAVPVNSDLVDCPICKAKIKNNEINGHLDECLNKEILDSLKKRDDRRPDEQAISKIVDKIDLEHINRVSPVLSYNGNINAETSKPYFQINTATVNTNKIKKPVTLIKKTELTFDFNDTNKAKSINYDDHTQQSINFITYKDESLDVGVDVLPSVEGDGTGKIENRPIKIEPGTSRDKMPSTIQTCACCGNTVDKPIAEHLDECLAFFDNNTTVPEESASTSFTNQTIVIDDDDDDIFDETLTMNATGTKNPCPCCLEMVESAVMNEHLDVCLR